MPPRLDIPDRHQPSKSLRKASEKATHRENVENGRLWIVGVAVLTMLQGLFLFYATSRIDDNAASETMTVSLLVLGLSGVLFYLWHLGARRPMLAAGLSIAVYLAAMGVQYLFDPLSPFRGIIFKFLAISGLVKALTSARKAA